MRRTTHFYVMVTSLYLLRLKGARSDYTENNQDFDAAQKSQNYSVGLLSTCGRLNMDDLNVNTNKLFSGNMDALNFSVDYEKGTWVSSSRSMHIKIGNSQNTMVTYYKDVEIQSCDEHVVLNKRAERTTVCFRQRIASSNRHSRPVNQYERREGRRNVLIPTARRAVYRREAYNRRRNASSQREMNTRREMYADNIRINGRRGLNTNRMRSVTRRMEVNNRHMEESGNLHRGNGNRRHALALHRHVEVDNQRYDTRRRNQRNTLSSEIRIKSDKSTRQVRSEERRHRYNGNEIQKKDFTQTSYTRQERRESRREVQESRFTQSSNIRRERRENIVTGRNGINIQIRNSEEFRQNTRSRSSNDNRIAAEERRERTATREYRKRHDAVRRESERSLNLMSTSNRRRVDDMRITTKGDKSTRLRYDARPTISREMSDFIRLNEERRLYNSKTENRNRRSEGIPDSRRSRIDERHADSTRHMRRLNVRGADYKTAASEHFWSLDERGISRAIVVGFIGILGRKLWQKQA